MYLVSSRTEKEIGILNGHFTLQRMNNKTMVNKLCPKSSNSRTKVNLASA